MMEKIVFHVRKLLELLIEFPPEHFFSVSSDKAVNPINIMGASNKLMEELILAYADKLPIKSARIADIAFSKGSLLQGFLERMNKKHNLEVLFVTREHYRSRNRCFLKRILSQS